MYVKNISRKSEVFIKKNGSTILSVMGAVGVAGTAISAVKATTKVSQSLELATKAKGEDLTTAEKVKLAAPAYIPTILLGTATVACIFGANILNKKHQAALTSSYILLDRSYKEYRNKVMDLYGEDAHKAVEEAIFEDNTEEKPMEVLELFYDSYSNRYFESTKFKVQQAVYFLNRELIMKDYAYVNEFYELLDIDGIDEGWDVGWSTEACLQAYWQPWLDFGYSRLTDENGREYHKIYFFQEPMENFEDYI